MTLTTQKASPNGDTKVSAPIVVPRAAPQRRIRPALVWSAVAMIVVGGLIALWVLRSVGSSGEYLALARQVEKGHPLVEADLTTVRISVDPTLRPVAASAASDVIGKHAAVTLVKGTLLTAAALTDQPVPAGGQQLVGVSVPEERLPNGRVKADSQVLLVVTSEENTTDQAQEPATGPPLTIRARVVDVGSGAEDGTVLLNVEVPERDGPLVAARAAAGRIVVILSSDG